MINESLENIIREITAERAAANIEPYGAPFNEVLHRSSMSFADFRGEMFRLERRGDITKHRTINGFLFRLSK